MTAGGVRGEVQGEFSGSGSVAPGASPAPAAGFELQPLWPQIRQWAAALGFSQIGVAGTDLQAAEPGLQAWLDAGCHGEMGYMAAHGLKRARPAALIPGTRAVITLRMDYLPRDAASDWAPQALARLAQPGAAVVSLYAQGRDYHKVLRQRLQQLGERIAAATAAAGGTLAFRGFTDSAPVLEVALATAGAAPGRACDGGHWRGKHTLALAREGGSMGFLAELFIDQPLAPQPLAPITAAPQDAGAPRDAATAAEADGGCGRCTACIQACPTGAITAPYRLDARRCISYLTIEHAGPIPEPLRAAIGNRIYGCDDCQLVCPWNKFARRSPLPDFDPRPGLGAEATLLALWDWDEAGFLRRTEGSAIRRIGHARWRRNLAVAMGNALADARTPAALATRLRDALGRERAGASALLAEHIDWALAQAGPRPAVAGN